MEFFVRLALTCPRGYPLALLAVGREGGGPPKPWNLIPVAVTWYVGAYEMDGESDNASRRKLQEKARQLVKKFVIEPCAAELPAMEAKEKRTRAIRWRDLKTIVPQIRQLREEVSEGRPHLATNL
jgi:hypothetical protein